MNNLNGRDDPFAFLEIKATQIRKLLLGSLLLSKDAWRETLLGSADGRRVLKAIEEAEEEFIDPTIREPFARLDNILTVINRRARALVELTDFIGQFAPSKAKTA